MSDFNFGSDVGIIISKCRKRIQWCEYRPINYFVLLAQCGLNVTTVLTLAST
jgi:hypothetical protein